MSERTSLVFALLSEPADLGLVGLGRGLGEVVAISARPRDPARPDELLQAAGAAGATRAVRIADPVLDGVDYLAVAHVLACAVRHLSEARSDAAIIVLVGDRGRGAVGPAVAERLAVPHLCAVQQLAFDDGKLLVDRVCGAELRRFVGAPPVVLACVAGVTGPVAAGPPGGGPAVERIELDALQITVPELQYRQRFRAARGVGPRPRPHVVSTIEHLAERLQRDALWPLPSSTSGPGR